MDKFLKRSLAFVLMSSILFISCKKSDNNDEIGTTFPTELQAVWQDEEFDDGDEIGLYFTANAIWAWDYFGDSYDQGEDCYEAFKVIELISYVGNTYTLSSVFDDQNITVTISVENDELTISGEEDGENFSTMYSRDSRNISDLTPACTNGNKVINPDKNSYSIFKR